MRGISERNAHSRSLCVLGGLFETLGGRGDDRSSQLLVPNDAVWHVWLLQGGHLLRAQPDGEGTDGIR